MPFLLNLLYTVLLAAISPWLLYKVVTTGKYRRGLWLKLSGAAVRCVSGRRVAWFHGVSVGEIHLLRQVVSRFRQRRPDWECVVSTTTDTGLEEARKAFPDLAVFYWPFDFSWAVHRALAHVCPNLLVLAEGELWPNMLLAAARRQVPVVVINGRLSPRSARRYQQVQFLSRPWLKTLRLCAAQTEEYARAFVRAGVEADRVHVTGSVKFDGVTADRHNAKTQDLQQLLGVRPTDLVWIAGSTQSPEEALVLGIYRRLRKSHPELRLFLVPRQRDRFDEVALMLEQLAVPFVRRSALQSPLKERGAIVLVDTIGELGSLWGLAEIAFVGGSLDGRRGGQNMIEPAAYGAAVVFGPHVWNFQDIASRLVRARGALQVQDGEELEAAIGQLVKDSDERLDLGRAAQQFVQAQQGATERTLDLLDRVLQNEQPSTRAA